MGFDFGTVIDSSNDIRRASSSDMTDVIPPSSNSPRLSPPAAEAAE